jgi:hypothetical protein
MKMIIPPLETVEDGIAFAQKANPTKEPLTIEVLRCFAGCAHYSDEDATAIIQTIEQLTATVFEAISYTENSYCSSEQQVVHLKDYPKLQNNHQLKRIAA